MAKSVNKLPNILQNGRNYIKKYSGENCGGCEKIGLNVTVLVAVLIFAQNRFVS